MDSEKSKAVGFPRANLSDLRAISLTRSFEGTCLGLVVKGMMWDQFDGPLPPIEEWIETVEKAETVETGFQWIVGDSYNFGEQYGDAALERFNYEETSRKVLRWVSRNVPTVKRLTGLKWSHHLEVAALEPEEQEYWLGKALKENWSQRTLRRAIKESKPSEYPIWLKYSDIWNFPMCDERFGIDFPGRIPGQAIQNLLYYYTVEHDLVIDPVAGGGTTIDVCHHEGRRCIAFDIQPQREDILFGDATEPWPIDEEADLVFMDPPYWSQLAGEYGGIAAGSYDEFLVDMGLMIRQAHTALKDAGILAILIAPMAIKTAYIDIPFDLANIAQDIGFQLIRRVSVPVLGKQQAGPQVMEMCKKQKIMAAALRDLLIFQKPGLDMFG